MQVPCFQTVNMDETDQFISVPFGLEFNPYRTRLFERIGLLQSDRWASHARLRTSKGAAQTTNCFIISYISKYSAIQDIATWCDMDSKPLLGECWFDLSGGPKPLPIRISSPGSIGNLYHGSCGRGGMAGLPVPSGNLGGFCWIWAAIGDHPALP